MGRYLDLLRAARRGEEPRRTVNGRNLSAFWRRDEETSAVPPLSDAEARKLEAAGWKRKRRGGLTIWERPDTGFWVSQGMAFHLLENKGVEGDQKA